MPWSFVSYVEPILRQLRQRGYEFEVPVTDLRREMMRETGVINSRKLADYMRVMEELGYIKSKSEHVVELCLDYSRPYEFVGSTPMNKEGKIPDGEGEKHASKRSTK